VSQRKEKDEMKRCATMKAVWLILSLAFTLTLASAASAQPGEFVKGVLQPLADGFPKQKITVVVADDPGSRDGLYSRALQRDLKGISPVPIMVSDEPATGAFGTFFKLNDLKSREGDKEGYYPLCVTIWGAVGDLHVEPIQEELGMDVSDMNMVCVTEVIPYVFVQRKNAPWGATFADFVKYMKANPGKARYVSNQIGSGNDTAGEWVMQTLGLPKPNKIPQESSQAAARVVAAGEGDFSFVSLDYAMPHFEGGRLDITMLIADAVPAPWNKNPNVVSSVQAGLPSVPMGIVLGLAVNKNVPPAHVEWLYKLFKAAAMTDLHKQREKTSPGLVIKVMSPAEANALKMKLYEYAGNTLRAIGLHKDLQKK
jgi:tripartite-type tricarboxylate transporter receptor subunit TctC